MPIDQVNTCAGADSSEHLNELQECKLHSIADIRFSNVDKVSRPSEKPVRLCNYMDVYTNDYINADINFMRATANDAEIERFGIQSGDVIITKDSEKPDDIGISTVVDTSDSDLVCGYHLTLLRPNQKNVDPTFLAKQLNHPRVSKYFFQQANGTTRYGLSSASIANTPLWLPRIETQKYCSAVMRLLDKCIAQTEAVIAKLKKIREGMLHDLLTYGLDKHGQIRDPVAHPEQFKNSSLGRIPKDWAIGSVKSLARNCDAKRIPVKQSERENRYKIYPYYGASGIIDYIDDYIFDGDFVLIGEDGENLRSRQIPLTFIVSGKFWVNNHAHILEPYKDTDIRFLAIILEMQDFIPWLLGSAQPKLTQHALEKVPLKITPHEEQKYIANKISEIDSNLETWNNEIVKLVNINAGLKNDLLTGNFVIPKSLKINDSRI